MNGLVSVIIPAYKAERFISQALESVKRQSYPHWELLVVEDGVNDGTEAIVQSFSAEAAQHAVRHIRHACRMGVSEARNTAMRSAAGAFLAFLDHDDIWTDGHLARSIEALTEQPADMVYSSAVRVDEQAARQCGLWGPSESDLADFPASLCLCNFIPPSATVLRASAASKVGLFDPGLSMGEDYDYWIRAVIAGLKIIHLPAIGCFHREHPAAATADKMKIEECMVTMLNRYKATNIFPAELRGRRMVELYMNMARLSRRNRPWRSFKYLTYARLRIGI